MNHTVSDIMSRKLVTVTPATSVDELMKLFAEKDITGAPVVDAQHKLVGVVSFSDMARPEMQREPHQVEYYVNPSWRSVEVTEVDDRQRTVEDIYTRLVISCDAGDSLERAADLMLDHGIHRLIVTAEGKVVGVVTSTDMIREFRAQLRAARA